MDESQISELARLKAYFPFRIVFGVIRTDTGEFEAHTCRTMARAKRLVREGHRVYVLGK